MKKKVIIFTTACLIGILILIGSYAIAEPSRSDIFLCMTQKQYEHKNHDDGKCDICGTTLWDPVKGTGCSRYEWCNKCARKVMDTANSL